jgi:hypothetical protein
LVSTFVRLSILYFFVVGGDFFPVHMNPDHGEVRQANVSALLVNARSYAHVPILNIAPSSKEKASSNCVEYAWTAHLPGLEYSDVPIEGESSGQAEGGLPLSWSKEVLAARDRVLSNPPFVVHDEDVVIDGESSRSDSGSGSSGRSTSSGKNREVFDGVHVRGGDKRGANDPLVGVPVAAAAEVRQHLMAHLAAPPAEVVVASNRTISGRKFLGSNRWNNKPSFTTKAESPKRLVVVASDTPELLTGLPVVVSEPLADQNKPRDRRETNEKPSTFSGSSSPVPFAIFRVPLNVSYLPAGWSSSSSSSSSSAPDGQRSHSGEDGRAVEGSALADLAVEMAILEQGERLVVSEHSNIGRRVVMARARRAAEMQKSQRQRSSSSSDSDSSDSRVRLVGDDHGSAAPSINPESEISAEMEEAFTVRYLYSMEVRRLLSAKVELGEWEMAVKRNDEDAVALLDLNQTGATYCAMPKDREAMVKFAYRELLRLSYHIYIPCNISPFHQLTLPLIPVPQSCASLAKSLFFFHTSAHLRSDLYSSNFNLS